MSVVYDLASSVSLLTSAQGDGSPGLSEADGLVQQQPVAAVLSAGRQAAKVAVSARSPVTPSIRGLDAAAIAELLRRRIDGSGARLVFIDEIGQAGPTSPIDGPALEAAMIALAAVPFEDGGTYADRVHMYLFAPRPVANPVATAALWRAMARSGGVWIEAYDGTAQWSAEQWLAWPRLVTERLAALGMDRERVHLLVRGSDQTGVWRNLRTGAACALLANGPGAYRIEDQAGFVREFRATFGTDPAPPGPSPVTCAAAPLLSVNSAARLAEVLELGRLGARPAEGAISVDGLAVGVATTVTVSLGGDPLGIAEGLGADPVSFWSAGRGRVQVSGPGVAAVASLAPDGRATVTVTPTAAGPIGVTLVLEGAPIRAALGPPADLAVSLAPYASRVAGVLEGVLARPTSWTLAIPLDARLTAGTPTS